jgi:hypothetical protein
VEDHPVYQNSQDNLPDSDNLTEIDHPLFAIIFSRVLIVSLDKEAKIQQDYEDEVKLCSTKAAEINAEQNCALWMPTKE